MATTTQTLDDLDKALLTEAQKRFPLDHRPFQVLGEKLGISEQQCLDRVTRLKTQQVLRQISAIFDARALGYQHTLAAMRVEPSRVDAAAQTINQHPGVSHTYQRSDPFNLWFSVAVPPTDSLEQVIRILHAQAKVEETIMLPIARIYKVGMKLDLTGQEPSLENQEEIYNDQRHLASKPPLSEQDIRCIRVLQEELPLLEMPFTVLAEQAETTEQELFAWARRAEHFGYMRRFAAILHHRNAGFLANALVVWQVPADQVPVVGEQIALFRAISHCYECPVYPNWPYALFTMIHAPTHEACMEIVKQIEERVGPLPHKNLFSTKEYKKERVKYFTPALDEWWQEVGSRIDL
ncbi:MAG: Lrp/AsnC family transcriptional regulator [Candidatus Omnitrophica bacterium]|nr:Lrp/AsnC family transcriptional regulator [Candidatus Omnitrophota bacterium]